MHRSLSCYIPNDYCRLIDIVQFDGLLMKLYFDSVRRKPRIYSLEESFHFDIDLPAYTDEGFSRAKNTSSCE